MREHLGIGGELWDIGQPRPAVHARLLAYTRSLGRSSDAEDVDYMLVQFLLPELLNAVEGVERSFKAMRDSAAAAQTQADKSAASIPR
jgi:hypothetical protein